jgi:glycosyltransferase involved in cell wall biosynthesis
MLAYNEERLIGSAITKIPRTIPGVNKIEVLVIDDGSTDKTVEMAKNAGADKIISHKTNMGVGAAFMTGIRNSISMDADIVVTVDGDGEANTDEIPELIHPIINNQFDVIVGQRFLKNIPSNYSKKNLIGNKIFTKIVSFVAGHKFSDTQSGYRAYSRDAISDISVVHAFTYTQEVLLDLHFKGHRIGDVPISFTYRNDSKQTRSLTRYTFRALSIIIRSMFFHRPIMAFGLFGMFLAGLGIVAKLLTGYADTINVHTTLSSGLILLGAVSFMMGLFASVVFKRQMFTEKELRHHLKKINDEKNLKSL